MAEVGTATVDVTPSAVVPTFTGFRAQMSKDADKAGKIGGGSIALAFKSLIGPALIATAVGTFSKFIAEAGRASDATDKFKSTMNFAGLDSSAITAATQASKEYAAETVYDLPTIQNTLAQLASNGIKDYTGLTKAAGNLNAVAGGNAETFKSVAMVMTQTAGAGKLSAENWNQMADAIPGAAGPLQKVMKEAGAYTGNFRDAMAAGQITAEEFNASLMELGNDPIAVEAAKSTATLEGAVGNLQATITGGFTSALDVMKPAITGAINALSGGLAKSFQKIGAVWQSLGRLDLKARLGLPSTGLEGLFAGAAAFRGTAEGFTFGTPGSFASGFAGFLADRLATIRDIRGGFVGFFAAMKTGIADATASGFTGHLSRVGAMNRQVWDALAPLGQVFAGLAPQIAGILPMLSPFGLVMQALMPVLPQVASLVAGLAAQIGPVLGQVLVQVTPLIGQLVALFAGNLVAVLPFLVQGVGVLGTGLSEITTALMQVLAGILPLVASLLTQLAPIITNMVTAVLPAVVSIFGNVVTSIAPLIAIIAGVLVPVIQALLPVIVAVFGVIAGAVTNAMRIVQGVIQVFNGVTSGNWAQVWQGIGNIFSGVWNNITSVVRGALQIVGQVVTSGLGLAGGFVGSAAGGIGRFFADTWAKILGGVSGLLDGVLGFFRDLPATVVSALSGAGSWLVGVGQNIVQGLANGIAGIKQTILKAVLNLVPEAVRGPIETALGIQSPSQVAEEWGRDLTKRLTPAQMVALGIQPQEHSYTLDQVGDSVGTAHAVVRRITHPLHVRNEQGLARVIHNAQRDAMAVL